MARGRKPNGNNAERRLTTQSSVNAAVKSICDIMRRSNCAGALQYVPELTWILFLRILDERETREAEEAEAVGAQFSPSLKAPYRWQDWASPEGTKRKKLQSGALGEFFSFVNGDLLPHLHDLRDRPNATPRQKVISQILSGVEKPQIDTEHNFLDVLDKIHELRDEAIDPTHVFPLSQVYEGLLLKMERRGTMAGSSLPHARSSARWSRRSTRSQVRRSTTPPAARAGSWFSRTNTCKIAWGRRQQPRRLSR